MAQLGKAHHIIHRSVCSPGKTVNFAATPYESINSRAQSGNPTNPVGYSWEGGSGSPYGYLSTAPGSGILAAGYTKDYANPRPDMRFMAFKGSGLGFTFTHQVKGKGVNYSQLHGNRGIRTELYELRDASDSTWECYSGGHVASSIILPQGVTSRKGLNGEDVLTIQSATPDAFLANLSLPQMPYILAKPANDERYAQWFLAQYGYLPPPAPTPNPLPTSTTKKTSTQNALGYVLQGTGQGGIADGNYIDPFAGFAYYRDQYTMKVGQLMLPAPANDLHFCNNLSSSRVVVEMLTNHVLANGRGLGQTFNIEIETSQDPEKDLLHFEASGGINSIIQEATQHGVWRAWWDSRSNFHFILDYYQGGGDFTNNYYPPSYGKIAATLTDGPSLIGELEIMPGSTEKRINRVAVKGQPFLSFGDATSGPVDNYYDMTLGATYPPNTLPGGNGTDVVQDNYMGKNTAIQAQRLFNKENAQTTFSWKHVPYPMQIMASLGRQYIIKAKDPKGAWDFSSGKRFVVTYVDGQLLDADNPNGGYWDCNASGIEI